jgi:hypothetical protein
VQRCTLAGPKVWSGRKDDDDAPAEDYLFAQRQRTNGQRWRREGGHGPCGTGATSKMDEFLEIKIALREKTAKTKPGGDKADRGGELAAEGIRAEQRELVETLEKLATRTRPGSREGTANDIQSTNRRRRQTALGSSHTCSFPLPTCAWPSLAVPSLLPGFPKGSSAA